MTANRKQYIIKKGAPNGDNLHHLELLILCVCCICILLGV